MLGASYISVGEIITAASQELRDSGFTHGLGRPFYLSAAQRGLSEMSYATGFNKRIFNTEIPQSLIIELPADYTSSDQMYVYQGTECSITTSTILFIKPNMYHFGNGSGYIAQNMGRNYDALQFSLSWSQTPPAHLYFAGEFNGKLYLSPSCLAKYNRLFVRYIASGYDPSGEEFKVPMWAREAITDYVIHKVALSLEREDPQFLARVIARKENDLRDARGSWYKAIDRYKRMDTKTTYDTIGYNFDFGHTP